MRRLQWHRMLTTPRLLLRFVAVVAVMVSTHLLRTRSDMMMRCFCCGLVPHEDLTLRKICFAVVRLIQQVVRAKQLLAGRVLLLLPASRSAPWRKLMLAMSDLSWRRYRSMSGRKHLDITCRHLKRRHFPVFHNAMLENQKRRRRGAGLGMVGFMQPVPFNEALPNSSWEKDKKEWQQVSSC